MMFTQIIELSQQAQTAINTELEKCTDSNSSDYQNLNNLLKAYQQLDALIKAAQDQYAIVGLFILWRQLQQSSDKLNAETLLHNYLEVLALPADTTFHLNAQPEDMSNLDTAKMFAVFPFLFMVTLIAMMAPSLLVSPMAWLYLAISALPLLITYCFDKPFSMSRWYQEMAGIEKTLAYSVLALGLFCLLILVATFPPGVTLLNIGIMTASTLICGLGLLQHSQVLESKYDALKEATISSNRELSSTKTSLQSMFTQKNTDSESSVTDNMVETLRQITL